MQIRPAAPTIILIHPRGAGPLLQRSRAENNLRLQLGVALTLQGG